MRWLEEGRIANAITIIALQWLALNRDRVRAAWR
jgi:ADP-ribose pyrophosphatase